MRILLHVGQPKTGTSTIQGTLKKNRRALRDVGVLYPRTGLKGGGHHRLGFIAEEPGAWSPDWIPSDDLDGLASELVEEIRANPADVVVLSSEVLFHRRSPGRLVRLLQERIPDADLEVYAFLRRQDLYLEAAYSQQLKTGQTTLSRDEFLQVNLDHRRADYHHLLGRWADEVGWDRVAAEPFEPDVDAIDVVERFVGRLGVEVALAPVEWRNTRLARDAIELLRVMPPERRIGQREAMLIRDLSAWSETVEEPPSWRHFWSLEERRSILDLHAESNARLAGALNSTQERFFRGEPQDDGPPYPGLSVDRAAELARFLWDRGADARLTLRDKRRREAAS